MTGPVLKVLGSSVFIVYPASEACSGITLEFARLYDHTDTVNADVTVTTLNAGRVAWSRINLLTANGRNTIIREAEQTSPEAPWRDVVSESCALVVHHIRRIQPAVSLDAQEPSPQSFLVDGYLPRGQITVLYGDGGTGKSLLALALAVSGIIGAPLSQRWKVAPLHSVLYLDWEADRQAHAERLWGLTGFTERIPADTIHYRPMTQPLHECLDHVLADRDRYEADFIICDSAAPAAGPEPESGDAAVRLMSALRQLQPATPALIAHVSKAGGADQNGRVRVFGSVFYTNLARSTVEVRMNEADSGPARLSLSLRHDKHNLGPRVSPSALAFEWDEQGRISVGAAEPSGDVLSLRAQLRDILKAGPENVGSLAELTGRSPAAVRVKLNEMKNVGEVLRLTDFEHGRGKKNQWGLADTKRSP